MEGEADVQRLLDKETNGLNERVEDLEERLEKAKRELKQKRESTETKNMEIETLRNVWKFYTASSWIILRGCSLLADDKIH